MQSETRYYPLGLRLEGQSVLVFGGGDVAERKVLRLLDFGAKVTVISPALTDKLRELHGAGAIDWHERRATEDDLREIKKAALVFASTNDGEANAAIVAAGRGFGVLVNRADDARDCDFILPSMFSAGRVRVGVFTDGQSPALAKWVRRRIEAAIGVELREFPGFFARVREDVKSLPIPQEQRAALLNSILESDVSEILKTSGSDEALARTREIIEEQVKNS